MQRPVHGEHLALRRERGAERKLGVDSRILPDLERSLEHRNALLNRREFNLRYDDAVNPLIDMPILYGYYAKISPMGVAGIEADVTAPHWDFSAQFVNSSTMNPRSVFDRDQYGNWVGALGHTILQGLRVGASAGRGPYLDRQWPFYVRGEANPNRLPGSSAAADVEFAHGYWTVIGSGTGC